MKHRNKEGRKNKTAADILTDGDVMGIWTTSLPSQGPELPRQNGASALPGLLTGRQHTPAKAFSPKRT